MNDPAFRVLQPWLQQPDRPTLWIADENALDMAQALPASANLCALSNRCDVVRALERAGMAASFCDFDFSPYPAHSVERVVFRIAKEKAVNHHVLNEACRLLPTQGELLLAGEKHDGFHSLFDKASPLFGEGRREKHGNAYLGTLTRQSATAVTAPLDTRDYPDLRLLQVGDCAFYSKPGLFGWDKIDQGSRFLIEQLPEVLARRPHAPSSLLDLGCGYGYLTLMTRNLPLQRRVATDNNAAALLAMARNADMAGLAVEVLPGDAGDTVTGQFELILCNPPFHQGFSVDTRLTRKFLQQAAHLLATSGTALFVVNAFVGLEALASEYFPQVIPLAHNRAFKVISLQH